MTQPEQLSKPERLHWSPGTGTDVWRMLCAAKDGNINQIRTLVEKDASIIHSSYDYRTPLSFAVCENHLEVARYLIEKGANPIESGTPDTLLQIAVDRGYEEMARLIEKAVSSNGTPGGSEIAQAIRDRDLKKVQSLLDASPALVHANDERSNQPIHWAVMSRQPAMISELLARGANINAERKDGARPIHLTNGDYYFRGWRDVPKDITESPDDIYRLLENKGADIDLSMAAVKGNTKRVKQLLQHDPSLANRNPDYVTYYSGSGSPLKNAAAGGHIEIVKLLLESGADPNLREEGIAPKGHALYAAVSNGHFEIAKLLLEHGAYPNPPVESSADALSIALLRKNAAMVELLCSYGAARSVEIMAYYGDLQTAAAVFNANPSKANDPVALENAASQGHTSFVKLMLRYQPDLAKRIAVGVDSQGTADPIQSEELTEFLFQHGMDPNFRNWLGITPLHRFAQRDDVANALIFIKHGADVNAIDEQFLSTPLGYAAKYGKTRMVEFLLNNNADPSLPENPTWAQPLSWAQRRGHETIVQLLNNHAT
ncbi:MAG TPA: ankyrin repeat domain-containing protein [Chitinophagaceae bacterium]